MAENIFKKIKKIIDIESDASKVSTIEQIKKDEYLRGSNVFYLLCSALLASVGLDTGSPTVIIGAMLISPLMSPILGIGLSLGIHDKENFLISLREFAFSVTLSLLVSVIYFTVSPLGNPTAEIISRIKPTALDLIVAFFGGIAGIIAITRSKIASAIPGVAIATALMPPICTAGFGIATARGEYFFGAFYLFFINAVFIAFASYLIVRYLKFPFKEYPDRKKLFRTKLWIGIFVTLVAIPSFYIFTEVVKDTKRHHFIEKFIAEEIQTKAIKVLDWKYLPDEKKNGNLLNIYVVGSNINKNRIDSLNLLLKNRGLENTIINITQLSDLQGIEYAKKELKSDILSAVEEKNKNKESEEEARQRIRENDSLLLLNISNELKILYPEIEEVGLNNNHLSINFTDESTVKNIPVVTIKWNIKPGKQSRGSDKSIYGFLKSRLKTDTLDLIYNK